MRARILALALTILAASAPRNIGAQDDAYELFDFIDPNDKHVLLATGARRSKACCLIPRQGGRPPRIGFYMKTARGRRALFVPLDGAAAKVFDDSAYRSEVWLKPTPAKLSDAHRQFFSDMLEAFSDKTRGLSLGFLEGRNQFFAIASDDRGERMLSPVAIAIEADAGGHEYRPGRELEAVIARLLSQGTSGQELLALGPEGYILEQGGAATLWLYQPDAPAPPRWRRRALRLSRAKKPPAVLDRRSARSWTPADVKRSLIDLVKGERRWKLSYRQDPELFLGIR